MEEQLTPLMFLNVVFLELEGNEFEEGGRFNYASNILREFLLDEDIEYGDERYDWSASAAKELVKLEKEFWENK